MAAVQLTAHAVMSRIEGVGPPSGVADELFTCVVNDLRQIYEGVVAQGGVVVALQGRCQRIEDAAVPTTKAEELRGRCERDDQELKVRMNKFSQEVLTHQVMLQEVLQKAGNHADGSDKESTRSGAAESDSNDHAGDPKTARSPCPAGTTDAGSAGNGSQTRTGWTEELDGRK